MTTRRGFLAALIALPAVAVTTAAAAKATKLSVSVSQLQRLAADFDGDIQRMSFNRGAATQLGGELTKVKYRSFSEELIREHEKRASAILKDRLQQFPEGDYFGDPKILVPKIQGLGNLGRPLRRSKWTLK